MIDTKHIALFGGNDRDGIQMLFRGNWRCFVLSIVGILFKVAAVLGFSTFVQKIVDTISGTQANSAAHLIAYAAGCFACLAIGAILEYVYWTAFRSKALRQYREYTYNRILKKGIAALRDEGTAKYIAAMSNDLEQIKENYIETLPYIAELILSFFGTVIVMLYYNFRLAAIAFGVSLIPILVSSFRFKQVAACEERLSTANGNFLAAFVEVLHGFFAIKSMKSEANISAKLLITNKAACDAFSKREQVEISVAYIASIAGRAAQIIFFFISMILAQKHAVVSAGMIVVFVQLMQNIIQPAITMPELIAKMNAAERLIRKNDDQLKQNQSIGREAAVFCRDGIALDNVSVQKNDTEILHNLSFSFVANGSYAILGESGSGKTTLMNTLTGANREYSGHICFDSADIKDISDASLFRLISVIYQDVFIFDATIEENITMFGSCDPALLEKAIQTAGLTETIASKGLSYRCGENGNLLSGGEKQRIGIARSILRGADVLLFDEATSALDAQTGYQIIDTVQKMHGKTRIVITHDVYADLMERFDSILVLADGKIVETGKYEELLARKGALYDLLHRG